MYKPPHPVIARPQRGRGNLVQELPTAHKRLPRTQVPSQSTREKRTTINETALVGRGHVPADREAADGTNKQVCTQLVVPAAAGTCPRPTEGFMAMTNKTPPPCHCKTSTGSWRSRVGTTNRAQKIATDASALAIHTRKRTTTNETALVGRGHVPADREAADSRHKQVCTYLVVPARGLGHVPALQRVSRQ